jgi:hypothetical protein
MRIIMFTRIRLGLIALFSSNLLGLASVFLRGPFVDPSVNPTLLAQGATTTYLPAALLGMAGVILQALGFMALYAYLAQGPAERPAFLGMILSVLGGWLTLTLIGVFAFAFPAIGQAYLQGQTSVIAIAVAIGGAAFLTVAVLSGIASTTGAILFSVAFWRQGEFTKWAVVLYAASVPLFYFAPPAPYAVEVAGFILFTVASTVIILRIWQQLSSGTKP